MRVFFARALNPGKFGTRWNASLPRHWNLVVGASSGVVSGFFFDLFVFAFFGVDAFGHAFERGETGSFQGAVFFELLLGFCGETGPWDGFEALGRDRFACDL